MRRFPSIALLGVVIFVAAACQATAPAAPPVQADLTFTIRDIMKAMVEPRADSLWNAVATTSTLEGVQTSVPETDEEWNRLRYEAVTLVEAMNAIQVPGRMVARPGEMTEGSPEELPPDQIEALINMDREGWSTFARALQESVMAALKTIDAKDADGLSNAGAGIDMACENCHLRYWYPNGGQP